MKDNEEEKEMAVTEERLTVAHQLHEAMKEVKEKRTGKRPKGSALDMMERIRKDMENGKL